MPDMNTMIELFGDELAREIMRELFEDEYEEYAATMTGEDE